MAGENIELVREVYRAVGERDMERVLAMVDAQVVLDVSAVAFEQGMYRGHEGIRRYFGETWEVADAYTFEVEDAVEVDDQVAVTQRVRVVGAGSGIEVSDTYGAVWHIVDGIATEIRLYPDPAEARRGVGA